MKTIKKVLEFIWEVFPIFILIGSLTMSFIQSPWYLFGFSGILLYGIIYFCLEYKKLKSMSPEERTKYFISCERESKEADLKMKFFGEWARRMR